jgi:hypothetical protein
MPLPPLIIPTATRLRVSLTGNPVVHSAAGYRAWHGTFKADEPIVALAMTISGTHVSWTRTSHRGTPSLETRIQFSPYDEEGLGVSVTFTILDALTASRVVVDSMQTQPAPILKSFSTGELVQIAKVDAEPMCELMALFLARRDVASVRNGVWHARGNVVAPMSEPWRTILTYGRTGSVEIT